VSVDQIEDREALDTFYASDDPWSYDDNPADERRAAELLALVGHLNPERTLDIGCGNGFLTLSLPGREVLGCDLSGKAVEAARRRSSQRGQSDRIRFEECSLFDLSPAKFGRFDLIVVTGVLYPQYIGRATSVARLIIDDMARPGCHIASCHILDWDPPRLAHVLVDQSIYPYRNFNHLLEIVRT